MDVKTIGMKRRRERKPKEYVSISGLSGAAFTLLFGFFIGRAKIGDILRPFGTAYVLVCYLNSHADFGLPGANPYLAMAGVFAALCTDIPHMDSVGFYFSLIGVLSGIMSALETAKFPLRRYTAMAAACVTYTVLIFAFKLNMPSSALWSVLDLFLVCILIIVFDNALKVFLIRRKTVWTDEETVCAVLFAGSVMIGFGRFNLFNVRLVNVAGSLLTLVFSRYGGPALGAGTGIVCGFSSLIALMGTDGSVFFTAMLGISGLVCAMIKKKIPFTAVFCASSAVLSLLIEPSSAVYRIAETVTAGIIFTFLPESLTNSISACIDSNMMRENEQDMHLKRFRELTVGRLTEISSVFASAGKLFTEEKKEHKISYMLSAVPEKACSGCLFFDSCWDRGFDDSYALMQLLFEKYEQTGTISEEDLGDEMEAKCIRVSRLLSVMKEVFGKYIENARIEERIMKSKKAVGEQMFGISKVIRSLSGDMDVDIRFHDELEEAVRGELRKINVRATEICVETCMGAMRASLKVKSLLSEADKNGLIRDAVSKGCGCEMSYVPEESGIGFIVYEQMKEFRLTCGVSSIRKNGSEISGDTYSFEKLRDGRQMLLLCDGMGSGKKAARESTQAVTLVEDFYRAGFDEETVLNAINRLLILSSSDEIFSTMDMCMVKLTDGMAHFTKIGAPHSYLIRDGYAKKLTAGSLPMGILDDFIPAFHDIQLKNGDIIIMFTDGIADLENMGKDMFGVITDSVDYRDPQDIAHEIAQGALELYSGAAGDDMTVIVAKVQKLNNLRENKAA